MSSYAYIVTLGENEYEHDLMILKSKESAKKLAADFREIAGMYAEAREIPYRETVDAIWYIAQEVLEDRRHQTNNEELVLRIDTELKRRRDANAEF